MGVQEPDDSGDGLAPVNATMPETLPLFFGIGVLFGALGAVCAYLISYHEYRQRMLRLDQNPRRMAMSTAMAVFAFFVIAAIALSFVIKPDEWR